ncbi:MAG: hypothetical protein ACLS9K_08465 [Lachnospira eligens]
MLLKSIEERKVVFDDIRRAAAGALIPEAQLGHLLADLSQFDYNNEGGQFF